MIQDNLQSLLEAVKKDDVNEVSRYLSSNPEFFEATSSRRRSDDRNPFLVACKNGSRGAAEAILKRHPQLGKIRNKEGFTGLHLACLRDDSQLVELLLELDPELSFEMDSFSMIPLQAAMSYGCLNVITTFIAFRPESVRKLTPQRETLFHLAAKNYQLGAFKILLEEVQKLKQEHLLHWKDRRGNNVLHIAASTKQIEIVELLFPRSHTDRAMVRVNTLNKQKMTALDLYYLNSKDISTRDIGRILCEAGGLEGRSLPVRAYIRWTLETKNVILVVLGVIIGAVFTAVCNLPHHFIEQGLQATGKEFGIFDVVFLELPHIFYLLVFNTAILIVCMVATVALLWTLPFRPVVLFVSISIGVVYGLLVKEIMPQFFFRIGNHRFSSFSLVGSFAVIIICCGAIIYYVFACLCQFTKTVITKTTVRIL